jgi:hypothetical protein
MVESPTLFVIFIVEIRLSKTNLQAQVSLTLIIKKTFMRGPTTRRYILTHGFISIQTDQWTRFRNEEATNALFFGFGRRLCTGMRFALMGHCSQSSLPLWRLATFFRSLTRKETKFYPDMLIPLERSCMSKKFPSF